MSVRVRFALCPTGRLHVDDARTALFNWLFARHQGGALILRVQDVGERQVPGAVAAVCKGLRWLGLEWDEGPDKGGPHGPYVQSERLALYRRYAHQLVEEDKAYCCYCTPQRSGQPPVRDGRCRALTVAQRAELEAQGIAPLVRLKSPRNGQALVSDPQASEDATPDDAVLLRSNGSPTRHLASVVDDHHMAITHVVRGDEWLPSTPLHLSLYQAFGWEPPQYAHLPPIVAPDRTRLSRESADTSLDAYREKGYLALAMVNHLARLGWSPRGKRRLHTLEELAVKFDLHRVSHSPAVFDIEQLNWFNHRCLRRLDEGEVTRLLVSCWQEAYGVPDRAADTALTPARWQQTLALAIRDELHCLGQVAEKVRFAFVDEVERKPEAREALAQPYAAEVLHAFIQGLLALNPFAYNPIDAFVSDLRMRYKRSHGIRSRDVMYVVRAALSGRLDGPCLVVVCQLLGRERCVARAREALSRFDLPNPDVI